MTRADWLAAAALCLSTALLFAAGAPQRGFYADDGGMLISLPFASLPQLWDRILGYVPGRNLQILWQYLLFQSVGDPLTHLAALHRIQAALDGAVVAAFFLLLRLLRLPAPAALAAAALFSVWPNHGETHFWPSSAPMNLVSTLFLIGFASTSILLARGRPGGWLWPLDAAAFIGALFIYDQVFFALLVIAAVRAIAGVRAVPAQLPHLAATLFYVWLKLTIGEGGPALRRESLALLGGNIADSISWNGGLLMRRQLGVVLQNAAAADWMLGLAVATLLTALTLRRYLNRDGDAPPPPRPSLLGLALLFWVAAYLPVWLWFLSSRHHYLPTLGLFGGGAVCLAWLLDRLRWRPAGAALLAVLGVAVCALAAAARGESRFWEESFTLKKRLFSELRPDLENQEILVLEDFPETFGPATGFTGQDANYGPRLLFHGIPLSPRFNGDSSGAAAPGGIFLYTLAQRDGPAAFRYYPTDRILHARFTSRTPRRLGFGKNPAGTPPYIILASAGSPREGPFQVEEVSAARDGADVVVSLRVQTQLAPATWLAALASFSHRGEFLYWGRQGRQGALHLVPLLLSDPGGDPRSGGLHWVLKVRLLAVPSSDRIRLEFFAAARDVAPVRLGQAEAPISP